jgi:hypothetical protein
MALSGCSVPDISDRHGASLRRLSAADPIGRVMMRMAKRGGMRPEVPCRGGGCRTPLLHVLHREVRSL